jgi:hypothetical protein
VSPGDYWENERPAGVEGVVIGAHAPKVEYKTRAAFQTAYSMSRYLISMSTYLTTAKRVGTL